MEQFFISTVDHQAIFMAKESSSVLLPVSMCSCGTPSVFIIGVLFFWGGRTKEGAQEGVALSAWSTSGFLTGRKIAGIKWLELSNTLVYIQKFAR